MLKFGEQGWGLIISCLGPSPIPVRPLALGMCHPVFLAALTHHPSLRLHASASPRYHQVLGSQCVRTHRLQEGSCCRSRESCDVRSRLCISHPSNSFATCCSPAIVLCSSSAATLYWSSLLFHLRRDHTDESSVFDIVEKEAPCFPTESNQRRATETVKLKLSAVSLLSAKC